MLNLIGPLLLTSIGVIFVCLRIKALNHASKIEDLTVADGHVFVATMCFLASILWVFIILFTTLGGAQ